MFKKDLWFYSFPKDPHRRQVWIKACGNHIIWVPKRTSTICSEHFDQSVFVIQSNNKRKLNETAVPTLKLLEMHDNEVSALNAMKCQTADAKKLCIYDIGLKLKSPGQYDIGGTYTADQPDLWFFYVTSVCPGYNYLLNLFLCHRKPGIVSLGISNGDELTHQIINDVDNSSLLSDTLTWQTLKAIQPNGKSFVKTFCFSEADVSKMNQNTLVIPVAIQMDPKHLKMDVVTNRIKLQHDLGDMLFKQEKTDFIIKTPSQKEYKTHKIVLAAHSSVLRNMIKSLKENLMFIDITDNDLELLLEFLYTGTIKDIMKQNCLHLLEIAEQFQLKNLILLTKHAINKQKNCL